MPLYQESPLLEDRREKEVKGKDPLSIAHPSIQIWDGQEPETYFLFFQGRRNFGHEQ